LSAVRHTALFIHPVDAVQARMSAMEARHQRQLAELHLRLRESEHSLEQMAEQASMEEGRRDQALHQVRKENSAELVHPPLTLPLLPFLSACPVSCCITMCPVQLCMLCRIDPEGQFRFILRLILSTDGEIPSLRIGKSSTFLYCSMCRFVSIMYSLLPVKVFHSSS